MAGETTSFFANSIFSGINQGLQGRRALKEEERLRALKRQEEERLRQQAFQDIEIRNAMQDKRYENVLRPRALEEDEYSRQQALRDIETMNSMQDERYKNVLRPRALEEKDVDRANKIADYQQEQEIAQEIKNRALADEREQMINTAALLGRETKNPDLAYYGIAKAYGLDGFKPEEKDRANAHNSGRTSSIPKAIKSDDTQKKLQILKALRDYRNSVSETQDEFGNIIPAKLSDADRYELDLYEQRLVRDLYATQALDDEQLTSPSGTSALDDARAMLFGAATRPATNSAAPNPPTVDAPKVTPTEPDVTPSYTVSLLPVTEPTLYEDLARAGEIGTRALSDTIRQGRRDLGDYYDKVSAPTTQEDYSGLSTLQKIIYKLTGKNIGPRRLEQILNKER